jgi:hypothetical protein
MSEPQGLVRLEGLGKLKKIHGNNSGFRRKLTRD